MTAIGHAHLLHMATQMKHGLQQTRFAKMTCTVCVVACFVATPVLAAGVSGSHLVTEKELAVSGTVWVMSMIGVASSTWAIASSRNKDRAEVKALRRDLDDSGRRMDEMNKRLDALMDLLREKRK